MMKAATGATVKMANATEDNQKMAAGSAVDETLQYDNVNNVQFNLMGKKVQDTRSKKSQEETLKDMLLQRAHNTTQKEINSTVSDFYNPPKMVWLRHKIQL